MPDLRIKYERQDETFYVCRGADGCGTPLFGEDRARHSRHHAKVLGSSEQLEMQGSNVPFLDPAQDPEPGNFFDQDPPIDQTQVMRPRGRYNGKDWDK